MNQTADKDELNLKAALAKAEYEHQAREAQLQRNHEIEVARMQWQQKLMELAEASKMSVQQLNAQLAQTSQKLTTQVALSDRDGQREASKQVVTPPSEPAGQAQPGKAFQP